MARKAKPEAAAKRKLKPRTKSFGPRAGKREVESLEAVRKAVELRRDGLSYAEIGKRTGCAPGTAYKRVQRGLDEIRTGTADAAEAVIELELLRMDELISKVKKGLRSADPRVVSHCARTLIRASESRRKLLGLDAPAKVEVKGRVNVFAEWSEAELEEFARTGKMPKRGA